MMPTGRSVAWRLAAWLALIGALVLGTAGTFLYRSLERQFLEHDEAELVGKVIQLRHHAASTPGLKALQTQRLLDIVVGHPGMDLEIRLARGDLVASSGAAVRFAPATQPIAAERQPARSDVRPTVGDGRAIVAVAALGPGGEESVVFTVSRTSSERVALLAGYRRDLLRATTAGILAMAILGYAVARRALRPVHELAQTAGQITANHLGERLRVEDAPTELVELVLAFNAMLERLDESFQRLAQLSSDIAHELRTPVANLMAGTQVALSRPRSAHEHEALLSSSLEELERLQRMIENMLFLARADNAQIALQLEQVDMPVELARIADYFEGMAAEGGVRIVVRAEGIVVADATLFRRAVSNLVANAVRHTPRGAEIELRGRHSDGQVVVEVTNPGPAIDPMHLGRIFDRFYRADRARSDSHSGSGLGLAIVRSIMTLHGGGVDVQSVAGERTNFKLSFPCP